MEDEFRVKNVYFNIRERDRLSTFQLSNLRKLANFLYDRSESKDFDMARWIQWTYERKDGKTELRKSELRPGYVETYECGTVGCAIGHGPMAGIKPKDTWQHWREYCRDNFCDGFGRAFSWMFDGTWVWESEIVRDSPTLSGEIQQREAAQRIFVFLNKGIPTNMYGYSVRRHDPNYFGILSTYGTRS